MASNIDKAVKWYADNGWLIFPVAAKGKEPLTPHGFEDASCDQATVREWWKRWPDANIGLACGPSTFIALDCDPNKYGEGAEEFIKDLEDNYPTTTQATPTLGIHFLYALPQGVDIGNSSGDLPPGIDVRVKGYILLTPSVVLYEGDSAKAKGVPDGHEGEYAWAIGLKPTDILPQPVPKHVLDLLQKPKREPVQIEPRTVAETPPAGADRYALAALEKELDALARTPEGDRNNQLNISAFSLGQLVGAHVLDETEVVQKLGDTAHAIGLDEREIARTIKSGISKGMQQPRVIPAMPSIIFTNGHGPANKTRNDNDTPKPADAKKGPSEIILDGVHDMGYDFKMNIMRDRIEHMDGEPLHDGELAMIIANLFNQGLRNKQLMQDVILAQAWQNRYDPLLDFFDGLEWDASNHIQQLSGWFLCKSDPVEYADGHFESTFAVWLRRWLVGAVGKALDGLQNPMLVLAGGQGIGKSEFARWLCSPLEDYFVSSPIIPDNVDHLRWLSGNFIWEVAELGATTRKADIEGLKAFLTRPECTYRVPYAKNEVHRAARASFIGTINLDNAGFLMDVTGNRRFLSVEIAHIEWEKYVKNIDPKQIWAQALYLYQNTEKAWKLATEEEKHRDVINDSYGAEDPVLDAIERLFDITEEADPETNKAFMSAADIVGILATHVHETTTRKLQMDAAKALRRLNVTKAREGGTRGPRGYFGISRKSFP